MNRFRQISAFFLTLSVTQAAILPAARGEDRAEPGSAHSPAERPPVILSLGEQRMVSVPDLKRYSIGSPILRALPGPGGLKNTLLLKAVGAGITDLLVWKTDGTSEHRSIEVRAWKKGPVTDLEKRLSGLAEVEVWVTGDPEKGKVVYLLSGTVASAAEATRIGALTFAFPNEVRTEVVPSDALYRDGERKLKTWIAAGKYRDELELLANAETKSIVVRGSLPDPRTRVNVSGALAKLYPLVELETDSLPDRDPTIHFKVFLLELRKNRSRALGVDLPGILPGALRVSSMGVSTALSLEAAITALENDGSARVLSRPELVVRAPGEAELFAGGEVPIESKTSYSSRVEWKSYGLSLKLKVGAATGRKVRADILTEVSHLDPKIAIDRIPGLQSNRMKTQVDATFGEPLLLSGLLQEGIKKAARGLPFLKDIPVLGLLFGSQEFLEDRSELVAVLLPSRNVPDAPRTALGIDHPTGPSPLPRNWISPIDEMELRASKDFPFNAFAAGGSAVDSGNVSPVDLPEPDGNSRENAEIFQP